MRTYPSSEFWTGHKDTVIEPKLTWHLGVNRNRIIWKLVQGGRGALAREKRILDSGILRTLSMSYCCFTATPLMQKCTFLHCGVI